MHPSAKTSYFETEVLTAPPQKLQLMLLDGAIRFIGRGRQLWEAGKNEEGAESLIRAQQIVSQLIAALDGRIDPELTRKLASVYLFVFRALVEANLDRDQKKVDDALRVLETERETWRRLCEKLAAGDSRSKEPLPANQSAGKTPGLASLFDPPLPAFSAGDSPSGLSLEA